MIVDLDRNKLAELFQETYDPNLLYEENDDDDDEVGHHHHHHAADLEGPVT